MSTEESGAQLTSGSEGAYACEFYLLLYGVVELRAAQSPHVSEVERSNEDEGHSYPGSQE